ncbi:MAG: dynamin family protein [Chromatiales bacterium]|jgi:hypothetical protein
MVTKNIAEGLDKYVLWKQHIRQTLDELQNWLDDNKLFSEEAWTAFARCLEKLETDQITIAFVGEFSRGKTELINSLFFSDSGKRLLPSNAGRTTMCPTEILFDEQADAPYMRLLPIETRLRDDSLSQLRHSPEDWIEFILDPKDPDALENSLLELAGTRHVTPEEAARYGLLNESFLQTGEGKPRRVDIPKWRHAIISYPHPLLKKGLTILDTPGLNAIGSEPELTLSMLPAAQSAVFVLGADTGVTQSDLDIWQNHLKGHHKTRRKGLTVVLNKVDTLWDDLRGDDAIEQSIKSQILYTARVLGVPLRQIYPVSAQKALLALVREDEGLLDRSGIIELEDHLYHEVMNAKHQLIMDDINSEVCDILHNLRHAIQQRQTSMQQKMDEISGIHQSSDEAIEQLLHKTQEEQGRYRDNFNAFNQCSHELTVKAQQLQQMLDPQIITQMISNTEQAMQASWTSSGIRKSIGQFMQQLKNLMQDVSESSALHRHMVRDIYHRFQKHHGIGVIQPKAFSLMSFQTRLELILDEADAFRAGKRLALTQQSQLAKNFFAGIGNKSQQLFAELQHELNHWLQNALQPLAFQIEDQRDILSRLVQDLKLANQSRDTIEHSLAELSQQIEQQQDQIQQLQKFQQQLSNLPDGQTDRPTPYLVKSDSRQAAG